MHDKKLLAIVHCFKMWRHYFKYAVHVMHMFCNYNNLRYFMITKSLFACQAWYAEELAKFNFKIEYKPGKLNPIDVLS